MIEAMAIDLCNSCRTTAVSRVHMSKCKFSIFLHFFFSCSLVLLTWFDCWGSEGWCQCLSLTCELKNVEFPVGLVLSFLPKVRSCAMCFDLVWLLRVGGLKGGGWQRVAGLKSCLKRRAAVPSFMKSAERILMPHHSSSHPCLQTLPSRMIPS